MLNREHIHQMVDRLPDSDLPAIEKLLESLTEAPAVRAMRLALPDDEPVTAAEEAAISEAELDAGTPVPLEDLLAQYGMK